MIIAADLHITKTRPAARTDDWLAAQDRKLRFILKLAQESPPLVVAGDIFDKAKPGDWILRYVIDLLKEYGVVPVVVPGQHDLPYHSLENIEDCGLGVLAAAKVITLFTNWFGTVQDINILGISFGKTPDIFLPFTKKIREIDILLWHHMVITQPLWPGQQADKALGILRKYPQFDLICTGDNHQTFAVASEDGRWLINPGSMMRRRIDQVNHRPCVFRWQPGGKPPEQIFLPIKDDVLDLSVKEAKEEKDLRITGLMEGLKELDPELGLAFEDNLKRYMNEIGTDKETADFIWEMVR